MRREKVAIGLACLLMSVWTLFASPARADTTTGGGDANAARSVVLVIDTSGSMKGAKLEGARTAVSAYASALPSDVRVGVVAFASKATVELRPTRDRQAVDTALASLRPRGGTSLYDAVLAAVRVADRAGASRIVVITDGNDSTSKATLTVTANTLARSGIRLDAVDMRPAKVPGAGLRRLAGAGHGKAVMARNAAELAKALAALPKVVKPTPKPVQPDNGEGLAVSGALRTVLIMFFVGVLALLAWAFWLASSLRRKDRRVRRIVESYGTSSGGGAGENASLYDRSPVMGAALSMASRMAASKGIGGRLAVLLSRGGLGLQPAEWLLVQAGLVIALVVVFAMLTGHVLIGVLLGLVAGVLAGHGWLTQKAKRRARAFDERLPDALQLLASGLASGFAFAQAVDSVAQRGPEPVAAEFNRALAEARLGADLEDALERTAVRMDSRDLQLTVMSIRIQREVGGNLAETLRTTVATMRERAYLRRQVRTLGAEGRLSAYILTALPVGIAAFLFVVRGAYVRTLYTDMIGLVLVAGAVVSMTIGVIIMRKIIRVEA
ncbi:VWA domain-containing protein [Flindersiella endophytica]